VTARRIPSRDELEAAGLYEPDASHASELLNLLRIVAARGGTIEDMRAARARPGSLSRLAAELLFSPPGDRCTLPQAGALIGVPVDELRSLYRGCGLVDVGDDEPFFTDADARLVTTVAAAGGMLGAERVQQLLRVVGTSMARIADATISTFVTTAGADSLATDDRLLDATAAARALYDGLLETMDTLLRHHLVQLARPNVTGTTSAFEVHDGAVGFVDLVESTILARRVSLESLGGVLETFEAVAAEVVTSHGGRIIKFVGDEVMFRADTLADACFTALDIVDQCGRDPSLPQVRAAAAAGALLIRDGDCFGPVVNLAARATSAAVPGTVVAAGVIEAGDLPETLRIEPLAPLPLPGVDPHTSLYTIRRRTLTEIPGR
jgi:adenylate cyclase